MSLEDLYKFGKLEKHKTSAQEIKGLFGVAERCLKDVSQNAISLDLWYGKPSDRFWKILSN